MKKFFHSVLFAGLVLSCIGIAFGSEPILIKNATIVPVVGSPLNNSDLLIENGKIIEIGPNIQVPAGAKVIDATGKYAYPGMVAVMTAIGLTGYPGAGNDTDETGVSTPHMDPYDALNPEDDCIEVTRIEGITTAQTIGGSRSVINGKSIVLHLEGDLAEYMVIRRYVAQIINMGAKEQNKYPSTQPGVVSFLRSKLDQAQDYAKKQIRTGSSDKNKTNENEKEVSAKKNLEMEALVPVVEGNVPAVFIANDEVTIRNALEIIHDYELKGIIRTSSASGIIKYADRIAQKNIPVIWAGTSSVPSRWEPHDLNYHTAAVLAAKGVLIAFDPGGWGPGNRSVRNINIPAAISVAHGLSEQAALEALTINPARILGIEDEVGSLEVGKTANVVIWNASPIQGSSRAETVIIRGKPIPLTSFQTRLYEKFKKIVRDRMKEKK